MRAVMFLRFKWGLTARVSSVTIYAKGDWLPRQAPYKCILGHENVVVGLQNEYFWKNTI
jgi:hypothetical protein